MKDSDYHKITDWLDGQMNKEEQSIFESEMEKDPRLKKEAMLAKEALEAVNEKDIIDFRKKMDGIISNENAVIKPANIYKKPIFIILGIVLFSLFAYFVLFKKDSETPVVQMQPMAIYHKYYSTFDTIQNIENTRNETDSLNKKINRLIGQYNLYFKEENFQKAKLVLDSISVADPRNNIFNKKDLYLAKGILDLQTGQSDKAFENLQRANENMTWNNVLWYEAGALIKLERYGEAKEKLKKIIETKSPIYILKAKDLLDDLNRNSH